VSLRAATATRDMKNDPEKPLEDEKETAFLSRWSRKKEEARRAPPPEPAPKSKDPLPPELPPVDKLDLESDYRAFFHPKVGEDVRRAALKKLFSDPRFNVMDGLDVYIDDYSKTEPIPPEMLAGMKTAQDILRWAREDTEERERKERLAREQLDQERSSGLPEPAQSLEPPAPVRGVPDAVPSVKDVPETPKS
jgi:hypothetical protein